MSLSFSKAMIAPSIIVPADPTCHMFFSSAGVLGYRQENEPFGGSTAAVSCAAGVRPGPWPLA